MGFLNKILKKETVLPTLGDIADDAIVAMADGELIDAASVSDPVFAEQMLGRSVAFRYDKDKAVLCSPANGTLSVLFPTGHAFCVEMNNGVELLVHCGINTVEAKGDGFKFFKKKQGDTVKAGDPIVEIDIKKLSRTYDMSTMLIITEDGGREICFIEPGTVVRGQPLIK